MPISEILGIMRNFAKNHHFHILNKHTHQKQNKNNKTKKPISKISPMTNSYLGLGWCNLLNLLLIKCEICLLFFLHFFDLPLILTEPEGWVYILLAPYAAFYPLLVHSDSKYISLLWFFSSAALIFSSPSVNHPLSYLCIPSHLWKMLSLFLPQHPALFLRYFSLSTNLHILGSSKI